jgi:hypothetical protein
MRSEGLDDMEDLRATILGGEQRAHFLIGAVQQSHVEDATENARETIDSQMPG